MSSSNSSAQLTPAERALKESLTKPEFRDVHLYAFTRKTIYPDGVCKIGKPLAVLAIGSILKDSEHFAKLLTSGFAESQATTDASSTAIGQYALPDEYDYESDSDLDEFEEKEETPTPGGSKPPMPLNTKGKCKDEEPAADTPTDSERKERSAERPSQWPQHQILLPSVAHRTLCACVFYLYTGKVNFLPLRSAGASQRQFSMFTAGDAAAPLCSPKSMYRLAESYGMTALQDLAYEAILARLTPANIVEEAFSSHFARYDRLREHAVSYLSQHYYDPRVQSSLQDALERVLIGQAPHSGPLLRSLLGLRIAVSPPAQRPYITAQSAELFTPPLASESSAVPAAGVGIGPVEGAASAPLTSRCSLLSFPLSNSPLPSSPLLSSSSVPAPPVAPSTAPHSTATPLPACPIRTPAPVEELSDEVEASGDQERRKSVVVKKEKKMVMKKKK